MDVKKAENEGFPVAVAASIYPRVDGGDDG